MLNKEFYKDTSVDNLIFSKDMETMRIRDFEQWLNSEHAILDNKERKYLRNFVLPFYDNVVSVTKLYLNNGKYFIGIDIRNKDLCTQENVYLRYFRENEMYCGMEKGKHYTLKELGIFK